MYIERLSTPFPAKKLITKSSSESVNAHDESRDDAGHDIRNDHLLNRLHGRAAQVQRRLESISELCRSFGSTEKITYGRLKVMCAINRRV
jgi:hypothetical protein